MAPNGEYKGKKKFVLPTLVVGPADVNRLLLEMETLEDFLGQAAFKHKRSIKLPKTSRSLDALAELNEADLLQANDRAQLLAFLESLQQHAPVVHISFAAEPSAAFTIKIVGWMRANISSYVLVQVGLQPSIAAGCVVRTTNKVFDLSLGRFLRAQRHVLLEALHTSASRRAAAAKTASVEAVPQETNP
jgi:F0F1-type ATP synthase delta subunit